MRADKTRIGIIGHAYITRFVVIYHTNSAAIIEANKPCCTKFSGGGEGFSLRGRKPGGKIFGFLDKGGMSGAIKRECHAFGSRTSMVFQYLQCHLINWHQTSPCYARSGYRRHPPDLQNQAAR